MSIIRSSSSPSLIMDMDDYLEEFLSYQSPTPQPPSPDPGPMDDLPVEWIEQILSFVPIASLFRCMRVNKYWEYAARYELKTRTHLSIRRLAQCTCSAGRRDSDCSYCCRSRFSADGRTVCIADTGDDGVIKCLKQMENLKVLEIENQTSDGIIQIISHFREQLRVIRRVKALPLMSGLAYPALIELKCDRFDQESAAACPRLKYLTLNVEEEITSLPDVCIPYLRRLSLMTNAMSLNDCGIFVARHAQQVTHLDLNFDLPDKHEDEVLVYDKLISLTVTASQPLPPCPRLQSLSLKLAAPPSLMSNIPEQTLTRLTIQTCVWPDGTRMLMDLVHVVRLFVNLTEFRLKGASICLTEDQNQIFGVLFNNFSKLKMAEISFDNNSHIVDMGSIMQMIARQNPGLRELVLQNVILSDAGIKSMSELEGLQSLTIGDANGLTHEALVHLMTGPSADSLHHLSLRDKNGLRDMEWMEDAFTLMLEKRGLEPHARHWIVSSFFVDFCSDSFSPQMKECFFASGRSAFFSR